MAGGEKKIVTIDTAKGPIEVTVEADLGPLAAGNFVALAGCGFYDGDVFHRVVPDFVIQGGDPTGTGGGGPGYAFKDDPVTVPYTRGTVAMANAGPEHERHPVLHRPQGHPRGRPGRRRTRSSAT